MLRLTTLAIGSCRVPAAGARLPGWKVDLPALATLIETRDACVLVDTGYGPAFFAATRRLPARLYRWATPVTLRPEAHLAAQLTRRPDLVMLTHMHGDHVAGLADLPDDVPVAASAAAIAHLRGLSGLSATLAACPPMLRDMVLARRPRAIEAGARIDTGLLGFAEGHDLLGDGRLIAIPLPGHGTGQTGLWIPEAARFLVADAVYARAALRTGRTAPRIVLSRLGDATVWTDTFHRLCALVAARPDIRFDPSHCPETAP